MKFKQLYLELKQEIKNLELNKVSYFSAQSSFYIILSIFPFLILMITLSGFLPEDIMLLVEKIPEEIFPLAIKDFTKTLIEEARQMDSSMWVIIGSALAGVWSSSKGTLAIIRGLDKFSGFEDKRDFVRKRLKACIFTLLIAIIIVLVFSFMVVWEWLLNLMLSLLDINYSVIATALNYRVTVSFVLLMLMFTFIYSYMPGVRTSFRSNIFGAAIAAVGWMAVSGGFSIYVSRFSLTVYGSLTTIILFMLWLYVCLWLLFIGAAINRYRQRKKDNKKMA